MTHLVVMNGPAGVGKTTLCKHLARLVPGTVCISGDALRSVSPADAKDWLGTRSTYRASAALVCSYLEMGARRVLLDYIFETREAFDWFCGHLSISAFHHMGTFGYSGDPRGKPPWKRKAR